MKCSEITAILEQLAPLHMACDWDNVGLLAGSRQKEVHKIWLALDATDTVIDQVLEAGADILLTHHPLIFKPLKRITDEDFISRRIYRLIQNDISYYAMHTNFDSAPGCMADLASERLGMTGAGVLETLGEHQGQAYGIGRTGHLKQPVSLRELIERVKDAFSLPYVTVYGDQLDQQIERVAISPGSGGSMLEAAVSSGVQVMVTGDIGHHDGLDAVARGLLVIDAGHYGLEHIFMEFMEQFLKEKLGNQVEICKNPPAFPAIVI